MSSIHSRSQKTVFLLVGAKGSGKTYIGCLLEKALGICFIRVEQRLMEFLESRPSHSRDLANDGYDLELEWIDEALSEHHEVICEATGSSRFLSQYLNDIRKKYDLKLIRVVCPLDICFARVKRRSKKHQFTVTDEKVQEINAASHNVKLSWDLEIDNSGNASDIQIVHSFHSLRAERHA